MLSKTHHTWSWRKLSCILLLALLLPAGMTTQAASPASPAQFDCANVNEIPKSECEALVALYGSTSGGNWGNKYNWLVTNTPCSWYGVQCVSGSVTRIILSNNRMIGTIPAEIGNLAALVELNLAANGLNGTIPAEINNLTALKWLTLSNNQLSGVIPPTLGNLAVLEELFLSRNQLTGSIPPEIGNLTALTQLDLNSNQLSGVIPTEIGKLTKLRILSLHNNQLTGSIPTEIGQLTALLMLYLSDNQLSGPIPPAIGNLKALGGLFLHGNQLSSTIPSGIGNLTTLWGLNLSDNQLNDPIPSTIGNLGTLTELYLHNNPFSGEVPTSLTALTLTKFTFYDTDWCIPPVGAVLTWIADIPTLYGTGLVCGAGLGNASGTVIRAGAIPLTGIEVSLYRSIWDPIWLGGPVWQHLTTTHTTADGAYQFTGLGQGLGIDYRVHFVDPTYHLAPQYYDAMPTIATADVITITPGVPRTGIDAVLALPQPPAVEVETTTGSVAYNPDGTAQITMPAPNPSDVAITRAVTCIAGTPATVTLRLYPGLEYPMANVDGDLYQATIPAADLTGNATASVIVVCNGEPAETTLDYVGYITLFDPSGYVTDARTGEPVANVVVTLYNVLGWLPKTGPDDDRPITCESNLSKAPDVPWSQPAPTDLGIIANADVTPTTPRLPYQHTTADGYYGWDVSQGCWYVTVEAEGYEPLVSPVVGVPPEVTDLDLALTPLDMPCTPLTDVGILGPLNVTSTLYINTLYTFQAVITPTDASEPITYTWSPAPQTGQGTDTATYRWSVPDTYTVTLTAENCGGSVAVTREFVIEPKDMHFIYLPLVLRNH